jgi:hypothetical protein
MHAKGCFYINAHMYVFKILPLSLIMLLVISRNVERILIPNSNFNYSTRSFKKVTRKSLWNQQSWKEDLCQAFIRRLLSVFSTPSVWYVCTYVGRFTFSTFQVCLTSVIHFYTYVHTYVPIYLSCLTFLLFMCSVHRFPFSFFLQIFYSLFPSLSISVGPSSSCSNTPLSEEAIV